MSDVTALERAFQLAKSGKCASLSELIQQLKSEGYSTAQISGPALSKQLRALMKSARERQA
jgi:hypothetical protein